MKHVSPEAVGFSGTRLQRIGNLMQGYVDRGDLAGMIVTVARQGRTVYYEKFGWADKEAGKPMQDDTIFAIASMSKPITAVALMTLYEEGHFYLNTPISKFIPQFKDVKVCAGVANEGRLILTDLDRPITFRHLFTHTSGLSYGWNPSDPVDREYQKAQKTLDEAKRSLTLGALVDGLAQMPLAFQPGSKWRYSTSIDVLGRLAEIISGLPFDQFLAERIFKPLGMTDTAFFVPPEKTERVATVYGHPEPEKACQPLKQIRPASAPPKFVMPGGGLVSTVPDYARFCQMLVNGGERDGVRVLSPKTVALFSINHAPEEALPYNFGKDDPYHNGYGYSLGTRVLMDVSKSGVSGSVGEFGWDGAFATYFWIDPKEELYGLLMVQHSPNGHYPIHPQFKQLTYQAMV